MYTNEQRAARYVLAHLLEKITHMTSTEMQMQTPGAVEEVAEHVGVEIDWWEVAPQVRRYAELLGTEIGFAAEQGVPESLDNDRTLDRAHYSDTIGGYDTRAEVEARRAFYSPRVDIEQGDDGRWRIVV